MEDKVICNKSDLVNTADAIRSKLGVTDTYYVSELSSAIQSIETGGIVPSGTISITENGTVDVTQYASAEVNVSSSPSLQSKSVTYTSNGTNTVTPDAGYDGLSSVDVTVDVVADVPLVTVTFKATQFGGEINSPDDDALAEMKHMVISALVDGNISLKDMVYFSNQWGGRVFPFDVAVPQGSSVTICDNSSFGSGVKATNALVAETSADGIRYVYTVYNITDGATITIDVS